MDADKEFPKARLFLDDDLSMGKVLPLPPEQARYLGAVLRMSSGDSVALFNGRDGEWTAVIEEVRKDRARVAVETLRRPPVDEPGPTIAFAPVKKSRLDYIVEKCTELGAAKLIPVITDRTVVGRVNVGRIRAQAIEAAEQCERLSVPSVEEAQPLEGWLKAWNPVTPLIMADESGAGRPIADAVRPLDPTIAPGILIGPEGGFSLRELDVLENHAFVLRVGLGPRILRAETAAVVALSFWQLFAGDGRRLPRRWQDA